MKRRNTENIREVLYRFVSENKLLEQKLAEARILNGWKAIMGTIISKHTSRLYIHKSTLYVHISSAPLRTELLFHKEALLRKLNTHAQKEILTDMIIR